MALSAHCVGPCRGRTCSRKVHYAAPGYYLRMGSPAFSRHARGRLQALPGLGLRKRHFVFISFSPSRKMHSEARGMDGRQVKVDRFICLICHVGEHLPSPLVFSPLPAFLVDGALGERARVRIPFAQ